MPVARTDKPEIFSGLTQEIFIPLSSKAPRGYLWSDDGGLLIP